jgi:hypothetical protein
MSRIRRSRRRQLVRPSPVQKLRRIEQGEGGERALQDWLDRSRLAYLYLDQTPLTIPVARRADIKRPDFLVAVDGVGTIAVDAKAKCLVDGCFVLDACEWRRLDAFESVFAMPVWYACFPPDERGTCYLFRNRELAGPTVIHVTDQQIIRAPLALAVTVPHHRVLFDRALAAANSRVSPYTPHQST